MLTNTFKALQTAGPLEALLQTHSHTSTHIHALSAGLCIDQPQCTPNIQFIRTLRRLVEFVYKPQRYRMIRSDWSEDVDSHPVTARLQGKKVSNQSFQDFAFFPPDRNLRKFRDFPGFRDCRNERKIERTSQYSGGACNFFF